MVFCNTEGWGDIYGCMEVTILILIDGFLQYAKQKRNHKTTQRHNPYFNRWFSAIDNIKNQSVFYNKSQSLF